MPVDLANQWKRAKKGTTLGAIDEKNGKISFGAHGGVVTGLRINKNIKNQKIFRREEDGSLNWLATVTTQAVPRLNAEQVKFFVEQENEREKSKVGKTIKDTEKIIASRRGNAVVVPNIHRPVLVDKMDPNELRTLLFSLYDDQEYWTVKALVERTGQGSQSIRAALDEICDKVSSGPNRGDYALKPQHKVKK
eukprot:CAMPEP_0117085274 /NCGR_PEP_ID=MMETSP0472-20121206/59966_1 /TAXON_ID=693140 ORGANISM="Tiarina fusus, Strain LIS" /NCGR_SAMPLE_ID=MMETSP0472 /ASSEMBLY_ACC=CAM_ASM_000603 /LENGTH=192 /DNA_ID=CAMNT_0004814503 /DNA_START=78 /DNA_END=656 /DNA_ORIENTATION=+